MRSPQAETETRLLCKRSGQAEWARVAPPRSALQMFGGPFTLEQFRGQAFSCTAVGQPLAYGFMEVHVTRRVGDVMPEDGAAKVRKAADMAPVNVPSESCQQGTVSAAAVPPPQTPSLARKSAGPSSDVDGASKLVMSRRQKARASASQAPSSLMQMMNIRSTTKGD